MFIMNNPLLAFIALLFLNTAALAQSGLESEGINSNNEFERVVIESKEYGFVDKDAVWVTQEIPVCWENPQDKFKNQMNLVEISIQETWDRYSNLSFKGWEKCQSDNFIGIRILISDAHPHVKQLGSKLDGIKNGMVLNFTYKTAAGFQNCNDNDTIYELCVRSIGVHEFGHAIGLDHEQNRSDMSDENCSPEKDSSGNPIVRGTHFLTPYDPDSVMNYCNPKYNNLGKLSYFDILSVQSLYGSPSQ